MTSDIAPRWLALAAEDSQRFNLRIVRGRVDGVLPKPGVLPAEIARLRADVAIIRLPAGILEPVLDLIASGHVPIHADTLVYHSRKLDEPLTDRPLCKGLSVGVADGTEVVRIGEIAAQAFSTYRSHYHANPLFDGKDIAAGYAEWAVSYLRTPHEDHETWTARIDGTTAGFATCALNAADRSVEIVLNAVAPEYAGRGIYGQLLHGILAHYRKCGFVQVNISTQVWNYVVQRAWARAGFIIARAYDTYHVNVAASRGCS